MTATPLESTPDTPATSAHRLATASWLCPLLVIAINFAIQPVRNDPASRAMATMVFALVAFALATTGLVLGIAALAGVRRHGRRGLLFPALAGSVLSAGYVAVFAIAYLG